MNPIPSSNLKQCNSTLINGIASDYLSIDDRAIHYGDGLFETILCLKNSAIKLYYWQQHFQRLHASAQKLKIDCPDESLLLDDINCLLAQPYNNGNGEDHAYVIKIILTRGSGERGYHFPEKTGISRIVSCTPLATDYSSLLNETLSSGDLTVCQQQVSINEQLAGLKHLNRLDNVMARNEWSKYGYHGHKSNGHTNKDNNFIDGLMLNADGFVIEGSMSNIFAVKDGQIFTPALNRSGVEGVMRGIIIGIIGSRTASLSEEKLTIRDITLAEIFTMEEIFISNSLIGLKSVNRLLDVRTGNQQELQLSESSISRAIFDEVIRTKNTYATTL